MEKGQEQQTREGLDEHTHQRTSLSPPRSRLRLEAVVVKPSVSSPSSREYRLPKGKVLRLRKMIYRLKNSTYAWSDHFNQWMHRHGYTNTDSDFVTFSKIKTRADGTDSRIIIGMHVDDGIVCTNDEGLYKELIADLQKEFTLSSQGLWNGIWNAR